jgi:hypothetical protein
VCVGITELKILLILLGQSWLQIRRLRSLAGKRTEGDRKGNGLVSLARFLHLGFGEIREGLEWVLEESEGEGE